MAIPTKYHTNIAIPLPSDESSKAVLGATYDPAKALNVAKMAAGTVDIFPAFIGFVTAIFKTSGIDPKTREMIILRSAAILHSPYEWQANAVMAKNTGLTDKEIAAAGEDGPVADINPEYVLICKATDELSLTATLTDETLSEMLAKYDDVLCRKYIMMISWFNLLTRFLNGCRVPLETSDKIGASTSPPGS